MPYYLTRNDEREIIRAYERERLPPLWLSILGAIGIAAVIYGALALLVEKLGQ